MRILVDSSVLLRYVAFDEPLHEVVLTKMQSLAQDGHVLVLTPQVFRECWSVMTRPRKANGFGLTTEDAATLTSSIVATLALLDDVPGIFSEWRQLVSQHRVSGRQVHDANHVAAMIVHGIEAVLTLDQRDFSRYDEIKIMRP